MALKSKKRLLASWTCLIVVAAWGAVATFLSSSGQSILSLLLYIYGGIAFTVLTILVFTVFFVVGLRRREPISQMFPLPVLFQPIILGIVFFAVSFGLAFRLRLLTSNSALQTAATRVLSGQQLQTPQWIGAFEVKEVDRAGASVRFIVGDIGFDRFGIAYSPMGRPPEVGEDYYEHVFGPWWSWRQSW